MGAASAGERSCWCRLRHRSQASGPRGACSYLGFFLVPWRGWLRPPQSCAADNLDSSASWRRPSAPTRESARHWTRTSNSSDYHSSLQKSKRRATSDAARSWFTRSLSPLGSRAEPVLIRCSGGWFCRRVKTNCLQAMHTWTLNWAGVISQLKYPGIAPRPGTRSSSLLPARQRLAFAYCAFRAWLASTSFLLCSCLSTERARKNNSWTRRWSRSSVAWGSWGRAQARSTLAGKIGPK